MSWSVWTTSHDARSFLVRLGSWCNNSVHFQGSIQWYKQQKFQACNSSFTPVFLSCFKTSWAWVKGHATVLLLLWHSNAQKCVVVIRLKVHFRLKVYLHHCDNDVVFDISWHIGHYGMSKSKLSVLACCKLDASRPFQKFAWLQWCLAFWILI